MKTASHTLLSATVYGTASTVDGLYDGTSPDFNGIPQKAAAYFTKDLGIQTLSWYIKAFSGTITFEATLDSEYESANWFKIGSTISTIQEDQATITSDVDPNIYPAPIPVTLPPITENSYENVAGNYTWIRASVTEFSSGEILKLSLGY